jgi:glycerol uptake facilitator-like aquaporin
MDERLSGGNVAIALLANTIARELRSSRSFSRSDLSLERILTRPSRSPTHRRAACDGAGSQIDVAAQIAGAFAGVAAAHLMFSQPVFFALRHVRSGGAQLFSEFVATFGLLSIIWGCARLRSAAVPFAVGTYITAAYWFIASTSFANPAVTLARTASDTFAGIRPADAPGFIAAQLLGAVVATGLFHWLVPSLPNDAASVVVSHAGRTDGL